MLSTVPLVFPFRNASTGVRKEVWCVCVCVCELYEERLLEDDVDGAKPAVNAPASSRRAKA